MSKRKQDDDSNDPPPILKTVGTASGKYLAKRYKNSVRPEMKTEVPDDIKHLVYMQDYLEVMGTYGAESKHAPDYETDPDKYKSEANYMNKEITHYDPGTETLYWVDKDVGASAIAEDNELNPEELRLFVQSAAELQRAGWKFVYDHDNTLFFENAEKKMGYVVFDHYHIDRDTLLRDVFRNNVESDNALVLRNIPLNNTRSIEQHPMYGEDMGFLLRQSVNLWQDAGYDVRFTGYSLGGHVAKYWGSKLNIDQDIINGHVFPHNTFDETTATTNFHTIATDETDFKYILPSGDSVFQNDTHTVYPPSKGIEKMDITKGNIWGRHLKEGFLEPSSRLDIAAAKGVVSRTQTIGTGITAVQTGLGVGDVAAYVADKDYVGAGTAAVEQASWVNPIAGAGIMSTELAYKAQSEYQDAKYGAATRHGAESLAMAKAAVKANPESIFFAAEAIGSVEAAYDASTARKAGDKTEFGFKTAEATLLGAGAVSSLAFGPAGLLAFGLLAGGVGLADHIRQVIKHKRETRQQAMQTKTNGFEQHIATRNGPLWHSDLPPSKDAYVDTQRNYTPTASTVSGAMTRAPSASVSHSDGAESRQPPAWHYAFSDVKERYVGL